MTPETIYGNRSADWSCRLIEDELGKIETDARVLIVRYQKKRG